MSKKKIAHGYELARAYVVFQEYDKRYSPAKSLMKGTIFPELYMPYHYGDYGKKHYTREEDE